MVSHQVDDSASENIRLLSGKEISTPLPGDEVVITGMSGVFPNSNNIDELKENIYGKKEMTTLNTRFGFDTLELPRNSMLIPRIDEYDPGHFGCHWRLAQYSDPNNRLIFEVVYEALLDAGINPADLENTNTGVYVGTCLSESENWLIMQPEQQFSFFGIIKVVVPHRLAYFLKLKGPVMCVDTACSSSMTALELAFKEIRMGVCNAAIVVGANMCLRVGATLQFQRLGVLSPDAKCKTFDVKSNGYVRAEAMTACILQKAKDAKRVYAQIINAKANSDGYKEQGITYPSGHDQLQLLQEIYEESGIPPESVSYLEAHGTGTAVGDPEECNSLETIFCKNRRKPLPIGSVKSNMGHTEPASGLCSIVKVLLGMESGYIAPNINFNDPNPMIPALIDGRFEVVTESRKIEDEQPLIGVNSFGFGGSNAHVLLKGVAKEKQSLPDDDLPRIIFVSGRSEEAVTALLDDVKNRPLNQNHVRLLQSSFSKYIKTHRHRGYGIISKTGELHRSTCDVSTLKTSPLYLVLGEISDWESTFVEFSAVPSFAETLTRVNKFLTSKKLSINETILNPKEGTRAGFKVFGSLILEIAIADLLKELGLRFNTVLGHSYGELVCAYYDDVLTLNEVLNCALILNSELSSSAEQMNGGAVPKSSASRERLVKKLLAVLSAPRTWSNGSLKKKIASAEYFADATLNKNGKLVGALSEDCVVLEVGSTNLEDVVDALENVKSYRFRDFQGLLVSVGSLFLDGHIAAIDKLYPKVEFPVGRGTPMISNQIKWNRSRKWWVFSENTLFFRETNKSFLILSKFKSWEYISGHVIDGRNLFPASGYLHLAWTALVRLQTRNDYSIVFEDCRFLRATTLSSTAVQLDLQVSNSGYFEILEGSSVVVTGNIRVLYEQSVDMLPLERRKPNPDAMSQKDVYKELRLRGYNYSGEFRAVQEADVDGKSASIRFKENWVTFLDNMFQLKMLAKDTRNLYVPTSIEYIKVDCRVQFELFSKSKGTENYVDFDAFYYKDTDIIRSAGVEVKGLRASPIQRKKNLGIPVLETYQFVPNNTELTYEQSVRVNTQILLENTLLQKIKSVELVDSENIAEPRVLSDLVTNSFQDQPLIYPNATILSSMQLETATTVENKELSDETDCALIIGSRLFKRPQTLLDATKALKDNGYIISREDLGFNVKNIAENNLQVVTVHVTDKETLVLLNKVEKKRPPIYIEVSDDPEFTWLSQVQSAMTKPEDVVVYSQNNSTSGLLGFANCLKREPGCDKIRCVLVLDERVQFKPESELFADQLRKNLTVNVYKDGQWGTFRHLQLSENAESLHEHCVAKPLVRSDLSSFRWTQGSAKRSKEKSESTLVDIHYSSLNFRDVMTATAKISVDVGLTEERLKQDLVEGFEFSGKDANGRRVMGLQTGTLANMAWADSHLLLDVPDEWSLKEAASVVCIYCTIAYALKDRIQIKKGDTILIHSGTGGIGQAAIHYASHYGCTVYTTCGSASKKEFLLKKYPQLTADRIGNSRDTSFERMVMRKTNGRGVDVVLNSLADEKLLASVRCLARGGKFMEIGKTDLSNNTQLNLMLLEREASFHGIGLECLFEAPIHLKRSLNQLVHEGIAEGAIKPIDVTVFPANEVEQALRFMASGKHMGKVIVEVRPEDAPVKRELTSLPRFYCDPEKTYIILGGLGGFGLELADWMILRGARYLVLTSRNGLKNGYQKSRIELWKTYGVSIRISTANVATREGCQQLIDESTELAPIGGIFNLAVVLQDAIFENQSPDMYKTSLAPKAYATKHLDEITRKSCLDLDYFVVFSSVSCGRGNAGQTNYGMANSVMERICERRRNDGLSATAIQWGAIGEVGLVAEMQEDHRELEIGGTLQQRLSSCIEVMDALLTQKSAVVSSIVVAEKKTSAGAENVSATVANILGIELKSVQATQTLAELGMDSMTAIEIKQVFEREYGIFLTAKDIRNLTFARIKELDDEKQFAKDAGDEEEVDMMNAAIKTVMSAGNDDRLIVKLESNVSEEEKAPTIIFVPGIEGLSNILKPLAKKLNAHVVASHYDFKNPLDNLTQMTQTEVKFVESTLDKSEPIYFLGHSFGACLALEAISILEQKGYKCTVICLDGSPVFLKTMYALYPQNEHDFDTALLAKCIDISMSREVVKKYKEEISKLSTLDEKLEKSVEIVLTQTEALSADEIKRIMRGILYRLRSLADYNPKYSLKSRILFYKASTEMVKSLPKDHYLEQTCGTPVEVVEIEGDHLSIITNDKLVELINSVVNN